MQWPELEIPSFGPETAQLAEDLTITPLLAQLLVNRGLNCLEAREMLAVHPELQWPEPPFAEDLRQHFLALKAEAAPLAIFGDYDADGLSGTSVLCVFLRGAGFEVTPILPTRSEGYGLNPQSLRRLAESGHRLLITVDCGISNKAEIALAQELGLEVLVTDHHGLPETLPEAEYILHPAVLQIDALRHLSGAGMAYWLTVLLAPAFPEAPSPESLLDLAVIGTLADMTPLRGLNFALAKRGLIAARDTRREGLKALARHKKIDLETLTEDDLTFRMIPMLNAAGRIDSPRPALELLLSDNRHDADSLTQELSEMNTRRQELCQDVLADALSYLNDTPPEHAVVLADSQWLHGVLGITCSQLVQRYHLPVVLMAIEGDYAKASVRSPSGYHVLKALQACDALLVRYGGHEMAGGFTIRIQDIAAFSAEFNQICAQQAQGLVYTEQVEMEINPRLLSLDNLDEMRKLAPFGMGNPLPLFLSLNIPLQEIRSDLKSGTHFFAEITKQLGVKGWQLWDPSFKNATHFDMIFHLDRNTWRGKTQLQLTLKRLRIHEGPKQQPSAHDITKDPLQASPEGLISEKKSAAQSAKFKVVPPSKEKVSALPHFPGWLFDGQRYWALPQHPENETPQWQDFRHQEHFQLSEGFAYWSSEHPPEAEIAVAGPQQFKGIVIQQPPGEMPEKFWQQATQFWLAPLRPLTRLPGFRFLWEIIESLQDSHRSLSSPQELARHFAISQQQAEFCVSSLCDLGLLAYDKERYKLHYKNQVYDLRQSPSFRQASRRYEAQAALAKNWYTLSSEQLIKALRSGNNA